MVKVIASGRLDATWGERFSAAYAFSYVEWEEGTPPASPTELIERLRGYQVLITEEDHVTREVLEALPELALIIDTRAAPVNIDIDAATDHGVAVINTPGRNAEAVGDLTVMMMVMGARNVWEAMARARDGRWLELGLLPAYLLHQGIELPGKTIGLVGLGATGRATARRLAGFGVRLIAFDPFVAAEVATGLGVELVDLDTLLSTADFVWLHAPVTAGTRGMIGAREFGLMKPTAFFINSARAALVDQDAQVAALREGRIAGAVLDVYAREPLPLDDPLLTLPNVSLIPHLGGATREVADHQSQIAWDGLAAFIAGTPHNVVNPAAFERARARFTARAEDPS